ncbi:hypothetical protein MGI18_03105 [Bacillus sp. OVS6]|nr:hypothetical protein MGI18_03105 [Bacillus sp. OVS6]
MQRIDDSSKCNDLAAYPELCYSDAELNIMLEDIETCRKLGAAGVVIGALTNEKEIHEEMHTKLIRAARVRYYLSPPI